jgi:hypothetical protein
MSSESTPARDPFAHVPKAVPRGRARSRWPWILPLLALGLALYLGRDAFQKSGPRVRIVASEGHGLKVGDSLRYRGIRVGEVRAVELTPDIDAVRIDVELDARASELARAGSRFWIVRPHLALDEVSGLETVVGARYLAALPGPPDAASQEEFVALEEPPVIEGLESAGLEIQLEAEQRFGISAGAPIVYRGIRVGTILSAGLASDASQVDLRAYIEPEYAALVRTNTQFWEWGGLELGVGWTGGFRLEVESLRSLLVGGVAFATPDEPGALVGTGYRFPLNAKPEEEWKSWRPQLPVGSVLLPAGASLPHSLRVTRRWKGGILVLGRERSRSSWGLVLDDGLVGPREVVGPAKEKDEDPTLELAGRSFTPGAPLAEAGSLVRIALEAAGDEAWPRARVRSLAAPEDVLVCGDPGSAPVPVAASNVDANGVLEASLSFDESWHGAAVLARSDGALLGLLLVVKGEARIAPLP